MICSMTQRFFCPLIEDSATVQLQLNQAWLSSRPIIYAHVRIDQTTHTKKPRQDKHKRTCPRPLFQKNVPFALPGSIGWVPFIRHPVWTRACQNWPHPSVHMHNEFSNLYCVQALPSKACPSTWDSFTLLCLRVRCTFPFAKLRGGDALHFSSSVS